jgi:hypothetical protein
MLTLNVANRASLAVTVAPFITIAVATVVLAVAHVLHLTVAIDGTPSPLTITALVVALTTVILAGRRATLTTRRGAATTGRANATVRTIAAAV